MRNTADPAVQKKHTFFFRVGISKIFAKAHGTVVNDGQWSMIWQNREVYSYPKETNELHFFSNNPINYIQAIYNHSRKTSWPIIR